MNPHVGPVQSGNRGDLASRKAIEVGIEFKTAPFDADYALLPIRLDENIWLERVGAKVGKAKEFSVGVRDPHDFRPIINPVAIGVGFARVGADRRFQRVAHQIIVTILTRRVDILVPNERRGARTSLRVAAHNHAAARRAGFIGVNGRHESGTTIVIEGDGTAPVAGRDKHNRIPRPTLFFDRKKVGTRPKAWKQLFVSSANLDWKVRGRSTGRSESKRRRAPSQWITGPNDDPQGSSLGAAGNCNERTRAEKQKVIISGDEVTRQRLDMQDGIRIQTEIQGLDNVNGIGADSRACAACEGPLSEARVESAQAQIETERTIGNAYVSGVM